VCAEGWGSRRSSDSEIRRLQNSRSRSLLLPLLHPPSSRFGGSRLFRELSATPLPLCSPVDRSSTRLESRRVAGRTVQRSAPSTSSTLPFFLSSFPFVLLFLFLPSFSLSLLTLLIYLSLLGLGRGEDLVSLDKSRSLPALPLPLSSSRLQSTLTSR